MKRVILMKRLAKIFSLLLGITTFFGWLASFTAAEIIYLKNGHKFKGQVVEKTDQQVKVNIDGITLTYFLDEIDKIDGVAATQPLPASGVDSKPLPSGSPAGSGLIKQNPETLQKLPTNEPPPDVPHPGPVSASPGSNEPVAQGSVANKQQLIWQLIEASGTKENMGKIFNDMLAKAPPDQVDQIKAIFNIDEIILQLVPIYDKYFSQKEMQDLVNFYRSDSGRKLLQLTPAISQESMETTLHYFQKKMQDAPVSP